MCVVAWFYLSGWTHYGVRGAVAGWRKKVDQGAMTIDRALDVSVEIMRADKQLSAIRHAVLAGRRRRARPRPASGFRDSKYIRRYRPCANYL